MRLSAADRDEIWRRRGVGEPVWMIARHMGRSRESVLHWVVATGGIEPSRPKRSGRELTLPEREEISRGLARGDSGHAIAARLGRAPSSVTREVRRNGGRGHYRAADADAAAVRRRRRPKPSKLASSECLRSEVDVGLRKRWSPKQISAWLKRQYPDQPEMQVSPETIYVSLYVQGRGALRKELSSYLRSRRTYRHPKHELRRRTPKMLVDPILISQRPAEATDRAVPGHWEGDLLLGKSTDAVGTLVERSTRYLMLFTLQPNRARAEAVREGLAATILKLPATLRRSLAWDRGAEMSEHARFTVETGVTVYFCDPKSPWQRGSNENTNGLLRDYFPKGKSLARVSQAELDRVADELNQRPRQTLGWRTPAEALDEVLKQSSSGGATTH